MKFIFTKKDDKKTIRNNLVAECGVFLSLMIILNCLSNIYVARIFPEGAAINASFFIVLIIAFRHSSFWAATINLIASILVAIILYPGTMFPPAAYYSWWGVLVSIILDYIGSAFGSIILGFFLSKILFSNKNIKIQSIFFILFTSLIGFMFSFTSGFLVWGSYAQSKSYGIYLYSLIYNGTMSIGQISFALFLLLIMSFNFKHIFVGKNFKKELPFIKIIKTNMLKEWEEYTEHEFGIKIADGTLRDGQFINYILQDILYLKAYGKHWNDLSKLTNNNKEKKYALSQAKAIIIDELQYRQKFNKQNIKMSKETEDYINFMRKIENKKNYDYLFFALLACFIGYAHLGIFISNKIESNKYKEWLDVYVSKSFWKNSDDLTKTAFRRWKRLSEKDQKECLDIFKKTLILERDFFSQVI